MLTNVFLMLSTVPESKAAWSKYSVIVCRKKGKAGEGGVAKQDFIPLAFSFPQFD